MFGLETNTTCSHLRRFKDYFLFFLCWLTIAVQHRLCSFLLCKGESEGMPSGFALLQDVRSVRHRCHHKEPPTSQQPSFLWPWLSVLPEALPVRGNRGEPQSGAHRLKMLSKLFKICRQEKSRSCIILSTNTMTHVIIKVNSPPAGNCRWGHRYFQPIRALRAGQRVCQPSFGQYQSSPDAANLAKSGGHSGSVCYTDNHHGNHVAAFGWPAAVHTADG